MHVQLVQHVHAQSYLSEDVWHRGHQTRGWGVELCVKVVSNITTDKYVTLEQDFWKYVDDRRFALENNLR